MGLILNDFNVLSIVCGVSLSLRQTLHSKQSDLILAAIRLFALCRPPSDLLPGQGYRGLILIDYDHGEFLRVCRDVRLCRRS